LTTNLFLECPTFSSFFRHAAAAGRFERILVNFPAYGILYNIQYAGKFTKTLFPTPHPQKVDLRRRSAKPRPATVFRGVVASEGYSRPAAAAGQKNLKNDIPPWFDFVACGSSGLRRRTPQSAGNKVSGVGLRVEVQYVERYASVKMRGFHMIYWGFSFWEKNHSRIKKDCGPRNRMRTMM